LEARFGIYLVYDTRSSIGGWSRRRRSAVHDRRVNPDDVARILDVPTSEERRWGRHQCESEILKVLRFETTV